MALGTNYKRNVDREDVRRENNLDNHFHLMTVFMEQGLEREHASQEAYDIIMSMPTIGDPTVKGNIGR